MSCFSCWRQLQDVSILQPFFLRLFCTCLYMNNSEVNFEFIVLHVLWHLERESWSGYWCLGRERECNCSCDVPSCKHSVRDNIGTMFSWLSVSGLSSQVVPHVQFCPGLLSAVLVCPGLSYSTLFHSISISIKVYPVLSLNTCAMLATFWYIL